MPDPVSKIDLEQWRADLLACGDYVAARDADALGLLDKLAAAFGWTRFETLCAVHRKAEHVRGTARERSFSQLARLENPLCFVCTGYRGDLLLCLLSDGVLAYAHEDCAGGWGLRIATDENGRL